MKILVKAKPGSREDSIEQTGKSSYQVNVKVEPKDGKANAAIVKLLAKHFDVSPSLVEIISGHFSKNKVVNVHCE